MNRTEQNSTEQQRAQNVVVYIGIFQGVDFLWDGWFRGFDWWNTLPQSIFRISKILLELFTSNWLYPQRKSYPMLVNWCVIIVYRAVLLLYGHLLAASDHHLPALFPKEGAR